MTGSFPVPSNEVGRLATLKALAILDTDPEERFDRITRLAQRIFDVPIALVSFVDEDRQWFKSRVGIEATETARSVAFCAHAIVSDDRLLHVPDALLDDRFVDNPYVKGAPNIRFYAGAQIAAPDGSALGTLCVIDDRARELSVEDRRLLGELATMVEDEIRTTQDAMVDELTGLTNRRGFLTVAERLLEVCRVRRMPATVIFADIDGLKTINDRLGHAAGDTAIRQMAELMTANLRDSDVIARLGGDEFAILFTGAAEATQGLARLDQALTAHNTHVVDGLRLGLSAGTATFDPAGAESVSSLLATADAAMYRVKVAHRPTTPA